MIYLTLFRLKTKESFTISELIYLALLFVGTILKLINYNSLSFRLVSQVHRSSRCGLLRELALPTVKKTLSIHREPRHPNFSLREFEQFLGNRILCIKPYVSQEERGVLLIKYSESMPLLPYYCDMGRLLDDYTLVFEPSWSGYCTTDTLHFTKYEQSIFLLSKQSDDFQFISSLNSNLVPLPMGPCDWVDPSVAEPYLGLDKRFDIVMNSNWSELKRHHVLFEALSRITVKLRVALIGFEWGGRTKDDILDIARFYGVESQLEIFEKISFQEVMAINCQSKMALLLSLKEGSNRAIAEALFCDIPAIVLKSHVGGIVENINQKTGKLIEEKYLAEEIKAMLKSLTSYTPRKWAVDNISCFVSTKKLNDTLKEDALVYGREWTKDIVVRTNSPDLRYLDRNILPIYHSENNKIMNYVDI